MSACISYARRQLKHYCYIIMEKAVKAVSIEIPYNCVHKIVEDKFLAIY